MRKLRINLNLIHDHNPEVTLNLIFTLIFILEILQFELKCFVLFLVGVSSKCGNFHQTDRLCQSYQFVFHRIEVSILNKYKYFYNFHVKEIRHEQLEKKSNLPFFKISVSLDVSSFLLFLLNMTLKLLKNMTLKLVIQNY